MVDSLTPLPPISARVNKTQVTEKNPHHQNEQQKHKEKQEEEVQDEVTIEATDKQEESSQEAPKKQTTLNPLHNIDIEV